MQNSCGGCCEYHVCAVQRPRLFCNAIPLYESFLPYTYLLTWIKQETSFVITHQSTLVMILPHYSEEENMYVSTLQSLDHSLSVFACKFLYFFITDIKWHCGNYMSLYKPVDLGEWINQQRYSSPHDRVWLESHSRQTLERYRTCPRPIIPSSLGTGLFW